MSLSEFLAKSLIPRAEAEHLLAHVLGCERQSLLFKKEEEIAEEQKEKFFSLVEQRRHGCPVAYLLGKKGFYKEEFFVDANVLIVPCVLLI